jgi:outer membrane protein insertion porin family
LRLRFYIFATLITIFISAGCVPTRHLADNERLLYKIKLTGVAQNEPDKIAALYQQRPNRKILGSMPYLWIYYQGRRFYNRDKIKRRLDYQTHRMDRRIQAAALAQDSSRQARMLRKREKKLTRLNKRLEDGNWLMSLGEPPVLYDSAKTAATSEQISAYLNARGYFKNQTSFDTRDRNKKVTLTYKVIENQPYTYSRITDSIADPAIKHLYDSTRAESLIRVGQRYDEEVLANERDRIEKLLKNLGYYQFRKQFVTVNPDTSFEQNQVRLQLNIANEPDGAPHQVFRLGQVFFRTENPRRKERFGLVRDTIPYNGVQYLAYRHRLSPRILDKKIAIRPGQRFSQDRTASTQQQLLNLNMFRFLNIAYISQDSILTANISANPSQRFQETSELGVSYSAGLPGPFSNLRLTVRNIFGGAELLELGVRGAFEGQYSLSDKNRSVYTTELGGNIGLIFPQFLVPFNANKFFTRYNPRTRINFIFTDIHRQEFDRINQEFTFDYIWQKSSRLQFVFTPLDITINESKNKSVAFEDQLKDLRDLNRGQPTAYERSFESYFITSMNFMLLYNSNNYNHTLDAAYFRLFVEEAGILGNVLFPKDAPVGNSLNYFKYGRFNADYRRYIKLSRTNFLVSRFNVGIVKPFFKASALPYDKYFYAGGGTSVRAFRPRRLGPGSYFLKAKDSQGNEIYEDGILQKDENIEQPGELLIEGNLEYRFNIFSFWNGALFADAGNVWFLTRELVPTYEENGALSRENALFRFNRFYKEFGVGAGFGFRFDFNFLIARFDIATRIYDPGAESQKHRFIPGNYDLPTIIRDKTVLNLGIGYPF